MDMLTDRFTDISIMFIISIYYERYIAYICIVSIIDLAEHMIYFHSAALNQKITDIKNPILKFYFTDTWTSYMVWFCREMFYICVYLNYHFPNGITIFLTLLCFPFFSTKMIIHAIQIKEGIKVIVKTDTKNLKKKEIYKL
ncbi:hypothetical protein A3Q56_00206 [Intoshia linei]|uniref:CDP-diacylglycerol--inositol 3-phosphatidyltransferase n=1 Tax=Intoshia linei TaxID=1819745 RepID=A0A177BCV9_9BILA|nr:hypothetical protein A3Q56_00206 [Intoshia linei]